MKGGPLPNISGPLPASPKSGDACGMTMFRPWMVVKNVPSQLLTQIACPKQYADNRDYKYMTTCE